MIQEGAFVPPVKLNAGDLLLPYGNRVGVYRQDPDGSWELDVVYTYQDGAYRLIVTPQGGLDHA